MRHVVVATMASLTVCAGLAWADMPPRPSAQGLVDEGPGQSAPAAQVAATPRTHGAGRSVINHGSFGGPPYALVDANAVQYFKDEATEIAAGGYASDYEYKSLEATLITFDGNTYATDRGGCIYSVTVVTGLQAGDIVEVDNNYFYDDGTGYYSYWNQAPYWVLIGPYTHNATQTINNWLIYIFDNGGGDYTMVIGSGQYDLALNTDDLTTILGHQFRLTRDVKVWTGATLLSPATSSRGYTYSTTGITGGTVANSAALDQTDMKFVGVADAWVDDDWATQDNGNIVEGHVYGQEAFETVQRGIDGALPDATVNIAAGTYVENIIVDKTAHLIGTGATTVIYPAESDVGLPDPDAGPSFRGSQVIVVAAHNVEIAHLVVDGDNPVLTSGVVRNGADVDARNGIIEGDVVCDGTFVHDCTVKNIYLRGIYARSGGDDFHFAGNVVQNIAGGAQSIGIFNFGGAGIIEGNTVSLASDAIAANWSRGTEFLNNVITQSGSGVHTDNNGGFGGVADLIQSNQVSDSLPNGYGIWVFFNYLNTMLNGNTVTNVDVGLFAWGGSGGNGEFTNNTVDGQNRLGCTGIYITTGITGWPYLANVAATFTGNAIVDCDYAVYVEEEPGLAAMMVLYGNSLAGAPSINAGTQTIDASNNWWGVSAPAEVAMAISGSVDYTPWLAIGTDTSTDPGFQGDFTTLWVDDDSPQTGLTSRIQEGVNSVAGSTVHIAPGTYNETVIVNKKLTLAGTGSGVADTVITPPSGSGIVISASGASPADRLTVQDLRVTGAPAHGIEITAPNASYLTFDNVACVGNGSRGINTNPPTGSGNFVDFELTNCDLSSNTTGLRFASYVGINGLAIEAGHMDGNTYGIEAYTGSGQPLLTNVSVADTTFNNNTSKGMYFENLDTATFTNVTVNNSGTSGTWAAGVDINLKYHAFQDIVFTGCTITNCGTGDPVNGAGLTIKARDDGGYSTIPATLDNVLITDSRISGCQEGIRLGEPGKNNAGPTNVAVHNCAIRANVLNGIRNVSLALTNAEENSWGFGEGPLDATGTYEVSVDDCGATAAEMLNAAPAGALGNAVNGNVDYCPWLIDARLTLRPQDGLTCYRPGDTLMVEVYLSDVNTTNNIVGGDFFLAYDKDRLDFVGAAPGDDPFVVQVYEAVDEGAGTLDYGVGVTFGHAGTQADTVMARITFTVLPGADACEIADLVTFRVNDPPTKLSDYYAGAVYPALFNLAALTLDGTAPTLTGCDDVTVPPTLGECQAPVTLAVTAADNCGPTAVPVTYEAWTGGTWQAIANPYTFPSGTTLVRATAADDCGNVGTCEFDVTVESFFDIYLEVESDSLTEGDVTRCITFEVWDCDTTSREIVPTTVDFTRRPLGEPYAYSYSIGTVTIQVPCGKNYDCITARDKLHSLRRTVPLTQNVSLGRYEAVFTAAANARLLSGNLNDDAWIDILDFGAFSWQYTANPAPGADTDCSTAYPHADLTGNGTVNSGDFTPIFTNYLKGRDANCCGQPGFREDESAPVTRISVDELFAQGLGEYAAGDITGDGWLDEEDVAAFASGTGPAIQTGDLNCDGVVNFGDINPFVQALTSPATWAQTYPGCNLLNADVNEDGVVNFADINLFVALLSNP